MSEEIKGKCYQEHEPTPDKPCEIKTMVCNDIEIPVEYLKQTFVTVDGKKYIELQQKKQQLEERIKKALDFIDSKVISNGEIIDQIQNDRNPKLIWHLSSYGDGGKREGLETGKTHCRLCLLPDIDFHYQYSAGLYDLLFPDIFCRRLFFSTAERTENQ